VPDHSPVLREHGYHPLRVKRVVAETDDASSFVLDVPDALHDTFRYRPGQFCTFRVHVEGQDHLRSYSMSSAPGSDPDLTVTVKRVRGGLVSNWFLDTVTAGSLLEVTKPAGVFCPQDTARPVLGFCGGSGITPLLSIVKHVLATTERRVRLLYANRDRASVIFDDELAGLGARHPGRLELLHHLDADGGFLRPGDVAAFARETLDADTYICGPGPFMDLVESTLQGLGVEEERLFIERFLVEQQEKDAAIADVGDGGGEAAAPTEVTVILAGKSEVIRYHAGDTILETARRGGLRPPFSCESGNCATCMAFLKEGAVTMRVNNALTPEEVAEGWVLTCQGLPSSETVTVEYEAM
jgi:3-ketosteroid 9alpha-monooxygenase subunit B